MAAIIFRVLRDRPGAGVSAVGSGRKKAVSETRLGGMDSVAPHGVMPRLDGRVSLCATQFGMVKVGSVGSPSNGVGETDGDGSRATARDAGAGMGSDSCMRTGTGGEVES